MAFGAIIIGDEIISGKRQDKHFPKVLEVLKQRGLDLAWCLYLGDDRQRLVDLLQRSLQSGEVVFSFGGIGVTPDDHTRQAVAAALGVSLELHPDARREIESRFGADTTPERLMLGEFPAGSEIVPNPFNRIPGFSVRQHYFLPGFPEMAWPMMEWVLDTHCRHLHHAQPRAERALNVYCHGESRLLDLMQGIEARFDGVKVFSLPAAHGTTPEPTIELGVKGSPLQVEEAIGEMRAELTQRGIRWEDRTS
ncbi:MAG: molybdopterin-binding protein [Rhodocyclaceae bacterium]